MVSVDPLSLKVSCLRPCGVQLKPVSTDGFWTTVPPSDLDPHHCPLTQLDGGLSHLHSPDDDAITCLTIRVHESKTDKNELDEIKFRMM